MSERFEELLSDVPGVDSEDYGGYIGFLQFQVETEAAVLSKQGLRDFFVEHLEKATDGQQIADYFLALVLAADDVTTSTPRAARRIGMAADWLPSNFPVHLLPRWLSVLTIVESRLSKSISKIVTSAKSPQQLREMRRVVEELIEKEKS